MAEAVVNVIGADQVKKMFEALPKKIQNKLIRKGMTAAGRIVRDKARELAPVDTGALRDSIKARKPKGTKRGAIRRQVAATVPYAAAIEFGKGKGRKGRRKFLNPALVQSKDAILQAISDAVAEGVKEAKQ